MDKIGKRIAQARVAKGMNQSELARALGVTPQAVQKWEAGGAPRGARLYEIAKVLDTTVEYLLTGSISVEPGPDLRGPVPLISWVQAGHWAEAIDNFAPGDAEEWIHSPKKCGPRTFALRVRGVSMEPKFQDGDIIFVDPDAPAVHGRNVVVRLDDGHEVTFKQLVVEGDRKFLRPLNPDWPGPKLIPINGNATICGVVIGKWVPE